MLIGLFCFPDFLRYCTISISFVLVFSLILCINTGHRGRDCMVDELRFAYAITISARVIVPCPHRMMWQLGTVTLVGTQQLDFFCNILWLLTKCNFKTEVVFTISLLKKIGCSTTFNNTFRHNCNSVSKKVCFVHEMCWQN